MIAARTCQTKRQTMRVRSVSWIFKGAVCAALVAMLPISGATAEEISVTQWGQSLYGAPFAVAIYKGLFKAAGIDITDIICSGRGGSTVHNFLRRDTLF